MLIRLIRGQEINPRKNIHRLNGLNELLMKKSVLIRLIRGQEINPRKNIHRLNGLNELLMYRPEKSLQIYHSIFQ